MRKTERASIIRIVSDLIKADGIIDTREIDFLDDLRVKYGITKEDEILADSYTLAKGLKIISEMDNSMRHSLMNDLIMSQCLTIFVQKRKRCYSLDYG